MAWDGLPNSLRALIMMTDAGYETSTVDKMAERMRKATTDQEKKLVSKRLLDLLESGISEAEFLKELDK